MRYLALLLVLSCLVLATSLQAQATGLVVIGDSLSAHHTAWPQYLSQHYKVLAQNGRRISDYDVPRDILAARPYDTVIYYLGTNDMYAQTKHQLWQPYFITAIDTLQSRGFRVIVLIPPALPWYKGNLRTVMYLTCLHKGYECYPAPYDPDQMYPDGVHPLPEFHREIAYFIDNVLRTSTDATN